MILTCSFLFAQKQRPSSELGLFLGTSYYLGDLNSVHFKGMFASREYSSDKRIGITSDLSISSPAFGIQFRRNFNHRMSFKAAFLYGYVEAIDANAGIFQQSRNLSFRSDLFEFSGQIEIYFHEINQKDDKKLISPYFTTGLAVLAFNPQGMLSPGSWQNIAPYNTEFQNSQDPLTQANIKDYKTIQLTVPLGLGVKWYVSDRLSLSAEWGMRATFTDYLDDVSTLHQPSSYIDSDGAQQNGLSGNSYLFANGGDISDPKDYRQRGFANTDDWYNFTGLTISWLFQKPINKCND